MNSAADFAWLIPLLPLCGAVLIGLGLISFNDLFNRSRKPIAITLLTSVGASAFISYAVLAEQLSGKPPVEHLFIWASAGSFELPMGYVIDPLAAVMLALVTTIAFLVMIYSHGYMAHDPGYVRFFTYLALFSSSMLGLIVSPNLLEIYVFWELVGMCSYLLVGFWYDRDGAAHAAQKAFVVNRVGDFGLLLGILGLFWATGSFDFNGISEGVWNHTTLHMRSRDKNWTYLQMLLPLNNELKLINFLRKKWGKKVLWHLEAVAQQGSPRLAALPVLKWNGVEELNEIIEDCKKLGAFIFNPHVLTVEGGGLGVVDADQVKAKLKFDPKGLLNPGKLEGWAIKEQFNI